MASTVALPSDPLLRWKAEGDQLLAVASGAWTSANADRLELLTDSLSQQPAASVTLDIGGVGELDTFGGWLLERALRPSDRRTASAKLAAVPDRFRDLLAALDRTNRRTPAPREKSGAIFAALATLGASVATIGDYALALVSMFGALALAQCERFTKPPQAARSWRSLTAA